MDRLQAMEVFVRVVESGSFSRAADSLDMARSLVTRQVAALEAHLGVKLLARSTRRLSLTSEGSDYLEKCREILTLVSTAENDLGGDQRAPRGLIRLSVPMSFGLRQLMPLLADFMAQYPEVTLDVDFNDSTVNLIEAGLDMAIRITARLEPTQVARKLSSCAIFTVASPAYLARRGTPLLPQDLGQHDCLDYTGYEPGRWTYEVAGEHVIVPIRAALRANSGDALLDAAIRGLGICRPPSFIAATAIQTGQVVPILSEFFTERPGLYAVFPTNRYLPQRVRVLVDFLAQRIGPVPFWEAGLL
jgi:DNA-binding transcriptional LysR family regulator